jgi:hypothetical protein
VPDAPADEITEDALMATQVIAGSQNAPRYLTQDESRIYWTTGVEDGTVASVAKTGGVVKVLASKLENPAGLALHGDDVYWVERGPSFGPGNNVSGAIKRVSKSGGAVTTLLSGQPDLDSIVVDAATIYFGGDGGLYKMPIAGGAVTTMHVPTVPEFHSPSVPVLVADATHLYFTAVHGAGPILKIAKSGGAVTVLADKQATTALTLDATHLYWGTEAGTFRVSKSGGAPERLGPGARAITGIAVDGDDVFFTDYQGDSVTRVKKSTGSLTKLVVWSKPIALVADSAGLTWAYDNTTLGGMAPEPIANSAGIARGRR